MIERRRNPKTPPNLPPDFTDIKRRAVNAVLLLGTLVAIAIAVVLIRGA